MFRHPKYYKELRKLRNKLDQAISSGSEGSALPQRAPGQGLKLQAASLKQQASSKPEPTVQVQASSAKRQASQPE